MGGDYNPSPVVFSLIASCEVSHEDVNVTLYNAYASVSSIYRWVSCLQAVENVCTSEDGNSFTMS